FGFAENTDDLFVGKTLLHGDVLMWLMKTLLTSGCTNQRGAGQDSYEAELRDSGDMLYTWQYDIRWAAQQLRNEGSLKPVNRRRDLPWELA
ncbi:hypothetical protein ACTM4X_25350, partial [Citrobacter freundii]